MLWHPQRRLITQKHYYLGIMYLHNEIKCKLDIIIIINIFISRLPEMYKPFELATIKH